MDKSLRIELIRDRFERAAGVANTSRLAPRSAALDSGRRTACRHPLPPTRRLASDLGVSRSTLVRVYEQLLVEGYLQSRGGSATLVSEALPAAAPGYARRIHPPDRAVTRRALVATRQRDRQHATSSPSRAVPSYRERTRRRSVSLRHLAALCWRRTFASNNATSRATATAATDP
jgi:DNA-binding transcriptional MocR family regulator